MKMKELVIAILSYVILGLSIYLAALATAAFLDR